MSPFFSHYRRRLRWLPALCIAIIIFLFSATPGDEVYQSYHSLETTVQAISPTAVLSGQTPPTVPTATPSSSIDWLKAAHGFGYFWLGFSVLYALSPHSRWSPSAALILCCLYSFADEFHQMFTPGRSASPKDILLDTLAALVGVAVMLGVRASKEFFNRKREPAG